MIVDFLLKDENTVIEMQGPTHYLKPGGTEPNLLTLFKTKCLAKLGYKVVLAPYHLAVKENKGFDTLLLEELRPNGSISLNGL